jgi:hypothetical protein
MAYLICPECGAHNPLDEEQCRICEASLTDVTPVEEPETPEGLGEPLELFAEDDDHDLPDLLQGLKLDEGYEIDPQGLPDISLEAEDFLGSDEETGTPEWLESVRKRAQQEEDSIGDLTKKIESAKETVAKEGQEKHNDFESWLQKLRDEARDKAAGSAVIPDEPEDKPADEPVEETVESAAEESAVEAEPELEPEIESEITPETEPEPEPESAEPEKEDWLTRIRKAHGIVDAEEGPNAASRNLLDWLVALEDNPPEESDEGESLDKTQQVAVGEGGLPHDITRQIRVVLEPKVTPQALSLTREERDQADLLSTIIADEKADHPIAHRSYNKGVQWLQMLFLLVLVVGISLALFMGGSAGLALPQTSTGAAALMDWVEALQEDARLLLVFDYQPAYASEMTLVAEPVLQAVTARSVQLSVASSSASGPLLAEALLAKVGEGLTFTDVGYYPMASFGAYGMATGLSTGVTAPGLPEPAQGMLAFDYDGLLILSDNFEGAQTWIEQLSARSPETPIGMLVTSQAAPLLQPYFESGQIVGVVSGFSDAVALAQADGESAAVTPHWRAYQVGVVILMAAMVLGAVIALARASASNKRGER